MTNPIDNTEDLIDSRDVIARIAELAGMCDTCLHCAGPLVWDDETYAFRHEFAQDADENGNLVDFDHDAEPEASSDECEELVKLREFAEEGEGFADWERGETFIRDSYFETYARDLADDLMPSTEARELSDQWPFRHIDWTAAAKALQADYTSIDFDGVDYWARS